MSAANTLESVATDFTTENTAEIEQFILPIDMAMKYN